MTRLVLPYEQPDTPDEQSANNISALMQLRSIRNMSIVDQIKQHIRLVHIVQHHTMNKDCVY